MQTIEAVATPAVREPSTEPRTSATPRKEIGLAQTAATTLARRIATGHYQQDELLPSLRSLSVEFDVSIPTLRLALQSLEAARLVEISPRVGVRVRNAVHEAGFRAWPLLAIDPDPSTVEWLRASLRDYVGMLRDMQVRVLTEVSKLTDLEPLERAVNRLECVAKDRHADTAARVRAELDIYRVVITLSNHPGYFAIVNGLQGAVLSSQLLRTIFMPNSAMTVGAWRMVLKMMSSLDEETFQHAVRQLLHATEDLAFQAFERHIDRCNQRSGRQA